MTESVGQVLVTGASGWLGRGLLSALVHGLPETDTLGEPRSDLRIRAFVQPGEEASVREIATNAEIVAGDIRNAGDVGRFCETSRGAVLFHLAGVIHPGRVAEFYEVNVEGTRHVLDAAARAGVTRAVVMSSNSPCGFNPHRDHRFDEDSPLVPYRHYGRSKARLEQLTRAIDASGDLETVIVRAPWFYGPHQPPRQTLFFEMIRDGRAPIVGDGENRRSMSYIDNLAQGLLLAATVPAARGRIYWLADAEPYSMNEITDVVERLLEEEFGQRCAHRRLRLPRLASTVAGIADALLQSVGLYHDKVHVLSEMDKDIACSIERARDELGYRPTVALEEGMRRSLVWLRDRGLFPASTDVAGRQPPRP